MSPNRQEGTYPDDGSWIAPDGDYQDLTRQLCKSDPRLCQPDEKMARYGVTWTSRPCRVVCLDFEEAATPAVSHEFSNAELFRRFLSGRSNPSQHAQENAKPPARSNSVYIVEGANRDFVGVLGSHFGLHPSIIMEYERITTVAVAPDRGQSSILYSNWATRGYLCLTYQELIMLPDQARDKFRARCADTARIIRNTRLNGKFVKTGMIHRRCIFWSRVRPDQSGWDSIIFCDPPLRRVRILDEGPMKGHEYSMPPGPPGDGYIDFVPLETQEKCRRGPPRTSMADDLCFYLTTHGGLVDTGMATPDSVSFFLKKIVASHYTKHFDFLRKKVMETLRGMGRQSHFAYSDLSAIEANWSDTQTLERRLGHFFLDLEEILVQLGIPLTPPEPSLVTTWQDVDADFRFLYHRYAWIRESVDRVNSSLTGLASIVGNRQAFRDQELSLQSAERSRNITFIGLVFVPLAFIASLFSMAAPYGPGQDKFWLYVVICVPASVLVVTAYYVSISRHQAFSDSLKGVLPALPWRWLRHGSNEVV